MRTILWPHVRLSYTAQTTSWKLKADNWLFPAAIIVHCTGGDEMRRLRERGWKMIPPGIWFLDFPLFLCATHLLFGLGLKHTVIKDLGFFNGNYCVSNSACLGLSVKWKFSWRSSEVSAAMGLCGSLTTCPIDKRELEKIPSVLGELLEKMRGLMLIH